MDTSTSSLERPRSFAPLSAMELKIQVLPSLKSPPFPFRSFSNPLPIPIHDPAPARSTHSTQARSHWSRQDVLPGPFPKLQNPLLHPGKSAKPKRLSPQRKLAYLLLAIAESFESILQDAFGAPFSPLFYLHTETARENRPSAGMCRAQRKIPRLVESSRSQQPWILFHLSQLNE